MTFIENDAPKKSNILLVVSLLLNIVLASSTIYFAYQGSALTSEVSQLDRQVGVLNEQLSLLQEKYQLSQYQLEYYTSWAANYVNSTGDTQSGSDLIGRSSINIVAVREVQGSYEGAVMTAEVEIRQGEGRLLIDTQPRIGIDIQTSGQTAEMVVQNLTGISFSSLDVILTIRGDSEIDVVDGPSAGAAITVCILAALQNRSTHTNVFISGTVNPDGTIGKVGGLPYKVLAAAKKGAVLFLVPQDQTNVTVTIAEEDSPIPGFTIVRYKQEQVNLQQLISEQGYNIQVAEARTIEEAYRQFVY